MPRYFSIRVSNMVCLDPTDVGVVVAGYGMFPSWILPTATLSRGVISKVIALPSLSLHLPASLASDGSSERHTCAASESGNILRLDDISQGNTTSSQHNFGIKRDPKSTVDSSHCSRKLGTLPSDNFNNCVPVPVVMQTTCAVYAGSSGGPVVAVHPSHGEFIFGYTCTLSSLHISLTSELGKVFIKNRNYIIHLVNADSYRSF